MLDWEHKLETITGSWFVDDWNHVPIWTKVFFVSWFIIGFSYIFFDLIMGLF